MTIPKKAGEIDGPAAALINRQYECLYLLEGDLPLCVEAPDASPWYELKPGDGFYLPQGTRHQYRNLSDKMVVVLFGVAPGYLPL